MSTIKYKHSAVVPSYRQRYVRKIVPRQWWPETRDSNVPYMYVGVYFFFSYTCLFTEKKHFMVLLWHIQIASITPLVLWGNY